MIETMWFLCTEDFATKSNEAFQWNEWERISLHSKNRKKGITVIRWL